MRGCSSWRVPPLSAVAYDQLLPDPQRRQPRARRRWIRWKDRARRSPLRSECEGAHLGEFRLSPPWLTINCFLIRSGGSLVLVDAGFAGKTEHVGRLSDLNARVLILASSASLRRGLRSIAS